MTMKENGHWYDATTGEPCHFIAKKDGSGNRPTTLADARKNNWLPSVTTVCKVLDKPALRDWLIRQAVHAVVTAPDLPGEGIDAKLVRVLETESQQDEESQRARDLGSDIHEAMEAALNFQPYNQELAAHLLPAWQAVMQRGTVLATETILVGQGYAGKADLILQRSDGIEIIDFKTTKTLPTKGAWPEHRLQCAAYAAAHKNNAQVMGTSNIYLSTIEPGKFVIAEHPDWRETYAKGWVPLLQTWQWMNNYYPV